MFPAEKCQGRVRQVWVMLRDGPIMKTISVSHWQIWLDKTVNSHSGLYWYSLISDLEWNYMHHFIYLQYDFYLALDRETTQKVYSKVGCIIYVYPEIGEVIQLLIVTHFFLNIQWLFSCFKSMGRPQNYWCFAKTEQYWYV